MLEVCCTSGMDEASASCTDSGPGCCGSSFLGAPAAYQCQQHEQFAQVVEVLFLGVWELHAACTKQSLGGYLSRRAGHVVV
jgi:hypothetical protein